MKTTEEVGLLWVDDHPLDDDDLTTDIVETVLRKRMGDSPAVGETTRDIMDKLRAYRLRQMESLL